MTINKDLCELIADLEYIIGSECYNPNSYDGWNDIEGCSFRYPVSFPTNDGTYIKIKININLYYTYSPEEITPETISRMKYRFGSNEMFIGKGIIRLLEFLEERYGIYFSKENQQENKN